MKLNTLQDFSKPLQDSIRNIHFLYSQWPKAGIKNWSTFSFAAMVHCTIFTCI